MLVRPTIIGAALFAAASSRAQKSIPKHDIARWIMARMDRPGVGVVREYDTTDKVRAHNERIARLEAAAAKAKQAATGV